MAVRCPPVKMTFQHKYFSYLKFMPPYLIPHYIPRIIKSEKGFSLKQAQLSMLYKMNNLPQSDPEIIKKTTETSEPKSILDSKSEEEELPKQIKSAVLQTGGQKTDPFEEVLSKLNQDTDDSDSDSTLTSFESSDDNESASLDSDQKEMIEKAFQHPIKITEEQLNKLQAKGTLSLFIGKKLIIKL